MIAHENGSPILDRLRGLLTDARDTRRGFRARCPAHADASPSLDIDVGDDGKLLVRCRSGCTTESVVDALNLTMADLFVTTEQVPVISKTKAPAGRWQTADAATEQYRRLGKATTFDYRAADGRHVGRVARVDPADGGNKMIRQMRLDGDAWVNEAMPTPRPLYRLPELLAADADAPVLVTEGEPCTNAAVWLGQVATTSCGGAKSPSKTDWTPLKGRHVIVLPDNDAPGAEYAAEVARLTYACGACSVAMLPLCDLPGGDLVDWTRGRLKNGSSREEIAAELNDLVALATVVPPPAPPEVEVPRSGLRSRPFRELLDMPAPATLIGRGLAEQALVAIGGQPCSYKSFLFLDWALSIVHGVAWQGHRVRRGPALLFCAEGAAYLGRRCAAWLQASEARITGIEPAPFEIVDTVPALTTKDGLAALHVTVQEFVRRHGRIDIIGIDTLAVGLGPGADENDNGQMAAVLAELGRIRTEFYATVVVVHHLRKSGVGDDRAPTLSSLRGASALGAGVDQAFLVSVKDGEQVVTVAKSKDGEDGRELSRSRFQVVTLGTDSEGLPITSGVLVPVSDTSESDEAAEITGLLRHYAMMFEGQEFLQTAAEKLRPSGMSRGRARDLIDKARDTGRLPFRTDGKAVKYRLPAPGGA